MKFLQKGGAAWEVATTSLQDDFLLDSEERHERTPHRSSAHLDSVVDVVPCASGIELARKASCLVGMPVTGAMEAKKTKERSRWYWLWLRPFERVSPSLGDVLQCPRENVAGVMRSVRTLAAAFSLEGALPSRSRPSRPSRIEVELHAPSHCGSCVERSGEGVSACEAEGVRG